MSEITQEELDGLRAWSEAIPVAVDKARARFGGERRVLKITDPPKPWSPCKPGPDGKCVECGRPVSDAARALLGEEARDE